MRNSPNSNKFTSSEYIKEVLGVVGINANNLESKHYESWTPYFAASKKDRLLDYKQLRKVNPEAARFAVLRYLKTNNHNISQTAQIFGINKAVVYNILRKENEGDLKDRPRTPHHQHKRTPSALLEDKVMEIKNKTRLGPERLSRYLTTLDVPASPY